MKHLLTLLLAIIALFGAVKTVDAYQVPSFPSCTNPSGNIKVEYVSGQHAIVGDSKLHEGSDKVYSLFDGNVLQCFCPENGEGIQTNWWKISSLSQNDISSLKNQGWHFIPSGRDWGLDSDPYLAKNENYNCKGNGGGGGESKNDSGAGIGGGGDILSSFAPTGDNWMVFLIIIFGVSLVLAAISLRKK